VEKHGSGLSKMKPPRRQEDSRANELRGQFITYCRTRGCEMSAAKNHRRAEKTSRRASQNAGFGVSRFGLLRRFWAPAGPRGGSVRLRWSGRRPLDLISFFRFKYDEE
jgi:hypothetical protein